MSLSEIRPMIEMSLLSDRFFWKPGHHAATQCRWFQLHSLCGDTSVWSVGRDRPTHISNVHF